MKHDPPQPPDIDLLLREERWLSGFVRQLVGVGEAEDVLQDTWLAALRRPPRHPGASRTWLSKVAHNFARERARRAARRRSAESAVAAEAVEGSAAQSVERLATLELVVAAVLRLREPYRSAVLLRHYEGLAIEEVARRTNATQATVRQRTRRGLAQVRDELRRRFGPDWRGVLQVAVLPGLGAPSALPAVSSVALGALLMSRQFAFAAIAAVVLGGLAFTVLSLGDGARPAPAPASAVPLAGAERPAVEAVEEPVREPVSAASVAAEPAPPRRYTGRVLDPRGQPVAGVRLLSAADADSVVARSDAEGRFALAGPALERTPLLEERYVAVRAQPPRRMEAAGDFMLFVVAPSVRVVGHVVDADGAALQGVEVSVAVEPLVDFPLPLDGTDGVEFGGSRTDAAGKFVLDGLPGGQARLHFRKAGFAQQQAEVSLAAMQVPLVELRELEGARGELVGQVLDHRGLAVPDALVGLGEQRVHCDIEGVYRIRFDASAAGTELPLFAAKPGMQTLAERFTIPVSGEARRDLQLRGPALTISGVVLGPGGEPVEGAYVLLWCEEPIVGEIFAENLAVPEEVEPLPAFTSPRAYGVTGSRGEFTVPGLSDRSYRLRVFSYEHLALSTPPIPAGTDDVELSFSDRDYQRVEGRVVGRDGAPVAGVRISVNVATHRSSLGNSWEGVGGPTTDESGGFVLERAPLGEAMGFAVVGPQVITKLWMFEEDDPDFLEVVVERRCDFRVECYDPTTEGRIHLLDAEGERVAISRAQSGGGSTRTASHPLFEGKTPVLSASERAVTLVLGERTTPIALVPGKTTVLRL